MSRKYDRYDGFMPRTPPSQSARHRPPQGPTIRPSLRGSFLENLSPVEHAKDDLTDEPDPHDLSWSSKHVTRTSMVDNMLLSLDQFVVTGSPLFSDSHFIGSDQMTNSYHGSLPYSMRPRRRRGGTSSSSQSSDVDCHSEENGDHSYADRSPRGHRSNSGPNLPRSLRRLDGVCSRDGLSSCGQFQQVTDAEEDSNASRTRYPRPGSKSSSSSIDMDQATAGRRTGLSERRSASFDSGSRSVFLTESSVGHDSSPYDIDAAPMPTVPAGPRRGFPNPLGDYSTTPRYQSSWTPVLSRRNSNKSVRGITPAKGRSEILGTATIKGRENDFKHVRETPPSLPVSHPKPPAPSPTISFHKPSFAASEPLPSKERPGFFRRVFGSSKNTAQGSSEATVQQSIEPSPGHDGDALIKPRKLTGKSYPTVNNPPNPEAPHCVAKKTSFFRRRKKSVTDRVPPPLNLPHSNLKALESMKAEPSPVSSLRLVMNPYLTDLVSAPHYDLKAYPDQPVGAEYAGDEPLKLGGDAINKISAQESLARNVQVQDREGASTERSLLRSRRGLHLSIPSPNHDHSFSAERISNGGTGKQAGRKGAGHQLISDKSLQSIMSSEATDHISTSLGGYHRLSLTNAVTSPPSLPILPRDDGTAPAFDNQPTRPFTVTKSSKGRISVKNNATRDTNRRFEPTSSAEYLDVSSKSSLVIEDSTGSPGASNSDVSRYQTASNTPLTEAPLSPDDDSRSQLKLATDRNAGFNPYSGHQPVEDRPNAVDREQARKLFESVENVVGQTPAAAWLGSPDRAMIRRAYMELFNWTNMDILASLRMLCTKITLKGETQQVDRVLDAFSTQWCQCNPSHGFKAVDVVHTICYSLLLLNTDLHLADIDQKMTKNQFVRNTMPTIYRVASDAAPDGFETIRASSRSQTHSTTEITKPSITSLPFYSKGLNSHGIEEADGSNKLTQISDRITNVENAEKAIVTDFDQPLSGVRPLINTPFHGTIKAWEAQIETVLKDFYASIQKQRLPLYGSQTDDEGRDPPISHGSNLRRTPSTLSKCGSDIFPRARSADSRLATARWSSKPRSRARLYQVSTLGSSRTSLDDQSSIWTPSASSTWSKYSLGKTQTSMSVDSLGSEFPRGDYQQSIGFANALSHAIIREDSSHSIISFDEASGGTPLLEDETLELAGAPWVKEGSIKHKHHLDSADKRAKDRNWNECFAVIQKGWMRLFSFNASTRSMRLKAKQRQNANLVVGGGNWMENAEELWKFLLRQTIASALPPPGYSKSRPHVWALSLPTGAVHLFQVGTAEIVKEFVSTANYWSARLSKEPLMGGISNIEHGWSDAVINNALIHVDNRSPPSSAGAPRPSLQSSIRSSFDQQSVRAKLPADRLHISDWMPPQQTMMASNLAEADQLKALKNYVKLVEDDLQKHNDLRPAMLLAFSPRHPNAAKVMANWERKSSYLLREIVKFRTYIDCLQAAQAQKEKIYAVGQANDENQDRFAKEVPGEQS